MKQIVQGIKNFNNSYPLNIMIFFFIRLNIMNKQRDESISQTSQLQSSQMNMTTQNK